MCACVLIKIVFFFGSLVISVTTCSCMSDQDCIFVVFLVMFYHNMSHSCLCSDQGCVLMVYQ